MKKVTVFSALAFVLLTLSVAEADWWKGNTHTHSNLSDGDSPPAAVAARYDSLGYDFLVLTDHNVLSDFAQYSAPGFLCIDGEEITSSSAMHVNGLGITSLVSTGDYQQMVDGVNAQPGAIATFNHPTWSSKTAYDIYPIEGLKFMEIRNALVADDDEPIWDDVLSMGKQIYGVGSDDCHKLYTQSGKAWVVVRAPNLTQNEILSAMNAGDFYSSDGVVLNDYVVSTDSMIVDSQDGNLIEFIGFQGAVLASVAGAYAEYDFTDSDPYVRARVTNASGQHAWTQPVFRFAPPPLPPPPQIRGVSGANLSVVDATTNATSVWTVEGSGPDAVTLLSPPNIADVSVAVDGISTYREKGVMMASVRQNVRGTSYGTVEVSQENFFSLSKNILQIATSRATNGGEFNVNPAVAFFPFADGWIGGHFDNDGVWSQYYGVSPSNISQIGTDGPYEITIDDIDSQNDGMLFAIGGENGHHFLSTAPLADGSGWQLAVRNNTATTFADLESTKWSFVYVDYDAPGLTGGRISDGGTVVDGVGSFSVTHPSTGVYRINVTGYTPEDGVLLLTVADMETDGITAPADNIISYEADGSAFLVNVRDRDGANSPLENTDFVFAFLAFDNQLMPAVPGDANYDGVVNQADAAAMATHWGVESATWAMGDFDLDGVVGPKDASILAANWGYGEAEGGTVPEPSTLVLLMTLPLAVLFRRRRR
ncbi:MAG: CehA/McbA family metallohydrolase [Pirellulales bacterium]|nr:CehA/McbA family metallohydrolase [Pirellulales bacterium]